MSSGSFTRGLKRLLDELEQNCVVDHARSVSFALAVNINYLDTSVEEDGGQYPARYPLIDRDLVSKEF